MGAAGIAALLLSQGNKETGMSGSDKIKSIFLVNKAKENPFVSGGLRNYREYRDFGIADMTEGKVHIHMIKTTAPCPKGGSGLHYHDLEFQMVYCLKGSSTVYFEGQGEQHFEEGDCWVQPPCIKHNVLDYSEDYLLMEMTIPAEYETVQCVDED
jgi:quercetin dioxygenase-like cupin family protein